MIRTQHTNFTNRQPGTPEHLPPERGSRRSSRAAALLRRFGLVAGVAGVALVAITPVASAASATPNDFSSLVHPNPEVAYVDDCTVEIGVVFDTFGSYHKIGGVRVNCNSVHRIIKATVWQQIWNGSSAVNYGASGGGIRYNQAGSGYGGTHYGILDSPPVCGHYYYRTVALVQTENTGAYVYSDWSSTPAGGC